MNKLLSKLLRCLILSLLLITILPSNVLAEGENAYAYSEDNDGTKTYYYSVQAAMDATRKNLTIVMCKDWQITSAIDIVEGTTSKIEMNGKAIRRTDSRTVILTLLLKELVQKIIPKNQLLLVVWLLVAIPLMVVPFI